MPSRINKIKGYLSKSSLITASTAFFLLLYFISLSTAYRYFFLIVLVVFVVLGTLPFVWEIILSLKKGKFGVDVIALTAIIFALSTQEFVAAGVVLLMLSGGESLERFATERARSSIERLLRRAPTEAHLLENDVLKDIPVQDIEPGNILSIKPKEIVPIDGRIIYGNSSVDESVINGEPIPRDVFVGDRVLSGTINGDYPITISAETNYEKSIFSNIVRLVERAEKTKAPTVRLADRYSVFFTLFTFALTMIAFLKNAKLATAVLVVATPCPLILAAPIAFIAGMSVSAKKGIIVKNGGVFESIVKAKAFVFDKTGTLTFGVPSVDHAESYDSRFSENDILRIVSSIDQFSMHVLACGVADSAKNKGIAMMPVNNVKEVAGSGIEGEINGQKYFVGKLSFLKESNIDESSINIAKEKNHKHTAMYLAGENRVLGVIIFSDTIRGNAKEMVLKILNKKEKADVVLLTGDVETRAREVASELGIKNIKASCSPEDKVIFINNYKEKNISVVMIGDGVNDAPALSAASVGIALGSHGATVATDIADAVIMVDDIGKVAELVVISERTMKIAKQSIFAGIGLSIIAMIFAFLGYIPPVKGAILQEGIDVLVIINALRVLY